MLRSLAIVAFLLTSLTVGEAQAQYYRGGYGRGWGSFGAGYGTVEGSQAAGMGALISAQGAYNQMTADAAIAAQQAQSLALDNKLKRLQTDYQMQRLNEQRKAELERARLAKVVPGYEPPKPPRLSAAQLDPVTGELKWVPLLLDDYFQPERGQLQELFITRAQNPSSVTYTQVESLAMSMRNKLDAQHDKIATADFFAARHFIEALMQEAKYTGFEQTAQAPQS